jgi:O-succinylbenzoic acid--CoA ligase
VVVSEAPIELVEVENGVDPMPRIERIWARGVRVLPVARSMPPLAREALASRVAKVRTERAAGVVLPTSGSSGEPRLIDLSLDAMRASAELGARVIPFGPGDVWHASLAPSHVGGLMILMRAKFLGGRIQFGAQPRAWRDLDGATHVSLVAPQLARLLDDASPVPAGLKAVMLGGGPSPQALHERAIARGVPLFSTYGMTETCSQIATGRRASGDAETLAGPPLPGASVSIAPETGEILVDGPMLARGDFPDGALVPLARPYRTRDAGFLDERGRLHVVGRLDAMFISGGKNIHPETIERALCALDGVRAACVVGVPHAKWGMRPVAFIDLSARPVRPLAGMLRERLESHLEPHLVPDAFLAMPADEASFAKPSRARLAARLAADERFDVV